MLMQKFRPNSFLTYQLLVASLKFLKFSENMLLKNNTIVI